jgi:hypothetical protein
LLVVGAIVILMVRYAPDGLMGLLERLMRRRAQAQQGAPAVGKEGRP